MADIFKEILPSILKTAQDVLTEEKDYVPFVVNRALSNYYDCVFYANQMNMHPGLDKRMQYDYLRGAVRKMHRQFQPWIKKEKIEDLELIKEYYKCSDEKALDKLKLLTDDQVEQIRYMLRKGGKQ